LAHCEKLIGAQAAYFQKKCVVDGFRIQCSRKVPQQVIGEIGLQIQAGIDVRAHLMKLEYRLHSFDDMLDLVPTFPQQNVQERPGPSIQFAHVNSAEFQEMQSPLVKRVKSPLALKALIGRGVYAVPARNPFIIIKSCEYPLDVRLHKGQEHFFEFRVGIANILGF
jgi:hypothetical protein